MVRSLLAFVLLLFLGSTTLMGQSYVGVFAGLNSSKLSGDAPQKATYEGLMGANVGAHFDLKISKVISLSIQPSYSQEGTKVSYNVSGQQLPVDSLKIRLNYFSLPLFIKIASTNKRFYALTGIETGFLLDHSLSSNDEEIDVDVKLSEINVAMHFGAGYRIPLGYPRLYIELRYAQGLINITDEPVTESYIPRVKTAGFKVLVGVEIPLSKSNN